MTANVYMVNLRWSLDVVLPLFHNPFMLLIHTRSSLTDRQTDRDKDKQERLRGNRKPVLGRKMEATFTTAAQQQINFSDGLKDQAMLKPKVQTEPLAPQPYTGCITSESVSQSHLDKVKTKTLQDPIHIWYVCYHSCLK